MENMDNAKKIELTPEQIEKATGGQYLIEWLTPMVSKSSVFVYNCPYDITNPADKKLKGAEKIDLIPPNTKVRLWLDELETTEYMAWCNWEGQNGWVRKDLFY